MARDVDTRTKAVALAVFTAALSLGAGCDANDASGGGAGGAATGSGSGSGGGGADGSASGAGGGAAVPCSGPLSSRLSHVDVPTSVPLKNNGDDAGGPSLAVLKPRPSGGAVVGWWGAGADAHLHVTPLGADDRRSGDDLVLSTRPTNWFASLFAHDDGVAALAFNRSDWWPSPSRPNNIYFARWNAEGQLAFDLDLGRNYSGFYRAGKLAYSAGRYVAYYPVNNDPDTDEGGHEGDLLGFFGDAGQKLEGGWDWNCSHGGDQRVFIDGQKVGAVCDSDTYPSMGVLFSMNGKVIHAQPDATGGFSHVELGELVGVTGGYFLIFTTAIESVAADGAVARRPGDEKDVLLVQLNDGGDVVAEHWVTSTTAKETMPHVARYGEDLLVLYGTAGADDAPPAFTAEVRSSNGDVVSAPEALDVLFAARDELVTHPNGDVGWAAPLPDQSGVRVYRLAHCE